MKHVQTITLQRPLVAQMEDNEGAGQLLIKSILNFLVFGINPLFLLLCGTKVDNNGGMNGTGNGSN